MYRYQDSKLQGHAPNEIGSIVRKWTPMLPAAGSDGRSTKFTACQDGSTMLGSKPGTADALPGSDTTGGQDVAIVFATRAGVAVLDLLIQRLLAYRLLPEGRVAYAVSSCSGHRSACS